MSKRHEKVFHRRIYGWQTHKKMCSHCKHQGNAKIMRCTPIKIAKLKIVTIPNAGKDEEKLNHSYIPGGTEKWYSHSGKIF